MEVAYSKRDLSLCNELKQEYRQIECSVNCEKLIDLSKAEIPIQKIFSEGGYRKLNEG